MTFPLIGVVGGGQLARMMLPEANHLGYRISVLAEGTDVSTALAAPESPVGDYKDLETLRAFAAGKAVITFDHEHVPTEHLQALLAEGVNVQPVPEALIYAQDKLEMRKKIEELGLPNPRWREVHTVEELSAFGHEIGFPVILKTPRGGYDGKGVAFVDSDDDAAALSSWFTGSALLAEEKVNFTRELSALVARRPSGDARAWPVVHTIQVDGVCDEVIAPAQELPEETVKAAQEAALSIAHSLGVTGVMAAELFETPGVGPGFMINELAMRPHNTGHWTQNGSVTNQFEQHLRAVLDLPLGTTDVIAPVSVMKNILGGSNPNLHNALPAALDIDSGAKVHLYGKGVKPGRKIGHINVIGGRDESIEHVRARAAAVASVLRDA